ncbi:hypothetical protein NEOLI_003498 [Neolecta irregularis DAH-3]|uniref:Bactericidal permeability-increasing protein n=1 Tax=Neolecta irregularis (strain DAH-3) TaxID=1198029 RepID=A0A1U7LQJ9_NEOID|nr:hypothetical protein NEOLI_003498 [Neolecta irregularis DAH-3]|eukprot:OLL24822.1 hypothetical protein NEOLI_003498 [Neolecta irregularis DAH-3]
MSTDTRPLISKHSPDRDAKDASIRLKLKSYEEFRALSCGLMPNTDQIIAHIEYIFHTGILDVRNRRLSSDGRAFIRDFRAWLESLQALFAEKNGDDKFQEMIFHARNAELDIENVHLKSSIKGKFGQKEHSAAYYQLQNLSGLLCSNPEFRKLLSDSTILIRDMFADAAGFVAENAEEAAGRDRASNEELEKIEKPAKPGDEAKEFEVPSGKDLVDKTRLFKEPKGKAKRSKNDVLEYLKAKFPKQRQDNIINRMKKMISDIQQNADFSDAVEFILALGQKYVDRTIAAAEGAKEGIEQVETNDHFDLALANAKALILSFAGGNDLGGIQVVLNRVITHVRNDRKLKQFFSDIYDYFLRMASESGFVTSDEADAQAHELYQRGQDLLFDNEKYKKDMENLMDEVSDLVDAFRNDKTMNRTKYLSRKVTNDIVNEKGAIKRQVLVDLFDVVMPKMISLIKYIPIPRIEYQDRNIDLVLENLVFESDSFLPYRIHIDSYNAVDFVNAYSFTSEYKNITTVRVEGLSAYIKDVSFYANKKTGLLRFEDKGFADVFMDGQGCDVEIILEHNADDGGESAYFHVHSVTVKVHKFKYAIRGASHSFLATFLEPFLRPFIKRSIAQSLQNYLRQTFERFDTKAYEFFERVRVASVANNGQASPEAWLRAVFSKGRKAAKRQSYVIGTGEDILAGIHGPAGDVYSLIREAEDRAKEGKEWRSEVFDIKV